VASGLPEGLVLMDDPRPVERRLHAEHGLLARLKDRVEPAQDRHRQDHVAVLAAYVEVPKHVVGNAPDEVGDPVQLALFNVTLRLSGGLTQRFCGADDARKRRLVCNPHPAVHLHQT